MYDSFPKRITVFGGTGFLGKAVVQALARKGSRIRVPTRDVERAEVLQTAGTPGQITLIPSRLHTDADMEASIGEADAVLNLIGIRRSEKGASLQTIHVETAARLARLARENGVKDLIHFSTLEADLKARSRYGRSKALGEEAVRAFFPHAIILRPAQMFGPGDKFFEPVAARARFCLFLPLLGDGKAQRQPVYVGDVAEAVVKTLENPACRGRTFELGGPEIFTRRALVELTLEMTGRKRPLIGIPSFAALALARLAGFLGEPLLTRDEVLRAEASATVGALKANTLEALGLLPASLRVHLPAMVKGYRASL